MFAAPAKVASKVAEVHETNAAVKKRFRDDMTIEQSTFVKSLQEMEQQVILPKFILIRHIYN